MKEDRFRDYKERMIARLCDGDDMNIEDSRFGDSFRDYFTIQDMQEFSKDISNT